LGRKEEEGLVTKGDIIRTILSVVVAGFLAVAVPQISGPVPTNGSEWNIETVDFVDDVGYSSSLALDSWNNPHMSYYDITHTSLKYANWTGSGWSTTTVDSRYGKVIGSDNSIALDSEDNPHIAYSGPSPIGVGLWYANWTGSEWSLQVVDTGGVGVYASIALDSNDNPHVSYYDGSNADLKYANWTGSGWHNETVDSTGYIGRDTSIELDSNGYPHISYYDGSNNDLKYAKWTGSGWNIETVDSAGYVGRDTSLAVDSHDNPHISYFDSSNADLKYANWTGSGWNIETVDSIGDVGLDTSVALDDNDNPHISYFDWGNWNLKYANWTGSGWNIETVDFVDDVGFHTSLALDINDHPHISYYNFTGGDLKYATKAELGPPPEPVLSFSPSSLDFGSLHAGTTDTKTFDVWNSGVGTLTYTLRESSFWIVGLAPSSGTSTGESYTITVSIDTTGLLNGLHTGEIAIASNGGNGSVDVIVNVSSPRSVDLDIDPDTLNLKSKGRWITAYLITQNAGAEEIETSSLLLNNVIEPAWWDVQDDTTLMVKFDRHAVQGLVSVSDSVDIKITGQWKDGETFELHDIIRIIDQGR
jgi:hypothetical protein